MQEKIKSVVYLYNEEVPSRLDKFVKRTLPNLNQAIIEKAIRNKDIVVNSNKAQSSTGLKINDQISIKQYLHKITNKEIDGSNDNNLFTKENEKLLKFIETKYKIYDHKDFFAINKPKDIASQNGTNQNISIDSALFYSNKTYKTDYKLVHRLDKKTSGIFLIAKNRTGAVILTKKFADHEIEKTYTAHLINYKKSKDQAIHNIECYLNYKKISGENMGYISNKDDQDAKYSQSFFKFIKQVDQNVSVVEFYPKTGRMHQIRLHAKLISDGIVGDSKYSDSKEKKLMLEASKIKFNFQNEDIVISL
jgi:23S rRNA pseudouridine955/2504/2580 synthase